MSNNKTKGEKKLIQIVEDLIRNKKFLYFFNIIKERLIKSIDDTLEIYNEPMDEDYGRNNNLVYLIKKSIEGLPKKELNTFNKLLKNVVIKNGVSPQMIYYVFASKILEANPSIKKEYILGDVPKMCNLEDRTLFYNIHPLYIEKEKLDKYNYPVSINIHRFSSKRDVLEYISKEWDQINGYLEMFNNYRTKRIRQRKWTYEEADFIWENKNMPRKDLKALYNKKFNKILGYEEIAKRISIEKTRRLGKSRKINVTH